MAVTSNKRSKQTQSERREITQAKIMGSACQLFGEHGFANVAIDQIATETGMTQGAIYHHYGNKIKLFTAVTEFQEARLTEQIAALAKMTDASSLLRVWAVFIEACNDRHFVRIVLEDAPHILGKERWHHSSVLAQLNRLFFDAEFINQLELTTQDKTLLLRMLTSAMAEAALMIAKNPDYDATPMLEKIIRLVLP